MSKTDQAQPTLPCRRSARQGESRRGRGSGHTVVGHPARGLPYRGRPLHEAFPAFGGVAPDETRCRMTAPGLVKALPPSTCLITFTTYIIFWQKWAGEPAFFGRKSFPHRSLREGYGAIADPGLGVMLTATADPAVLDHSVVWRHH